MLFVLQSVKDLFLLLPRHCPAASLPRSEPRAFPKASAKVQPFLELAKLLASFFAILCIFLDDNNFHGALSLYIFTRARKMGRFGVNKSTSQQVYESTSLRVLNVLQVLFFYPHTAQPFAFALAFAFINFAFALGFAFYTRTASQGPRANGN